MKAFSPPSLTAYEKLIDNLQRIGGAILIPRCREFTALVEALFDPEEAVFHRERDGKHEYKLMAVLALDTPILESIWGAVEAD